MAVRLFTISDRPGRSESGFPALSRSVDQVGDSRITNSATRRVSITSDSQPDRRSRATRFKLSGLTGGYTCPRPTDSCRRAVRLDASLPRRGPTGTYGDPACLRYEAPVQRQLLLLGFDGKFLEVLEADPDQRCERVLIRHPRSTQLIPGDPNSSARPRVPSCRAASTTTSPPGCVRPRPSTGTWAGIAADAFHAHIANRVARHHQDSDRHRHRQRHRRRSRCREGRCRAAGPGRRGKLGFRSRGKSKDSRDNLPQVVVGMAVTRDGIPVRVWCWPGNTSDSPLIRQVKDELRGWTLGKVIWGGEPPWKGRRRPDHDRPDQSNNRHRRNPIRRVRQPSCGRRPTRPRRSPHRRTRGATPPGPLHPSRTHQPGTRPDRVGGRRTEPNVTEPLPSATRSWSSP
jgi:hypothetical protein